MYSQKTFSLFIHFLLIVSMLFVACKEDNPGVILEETQKAAVLKDTTYVLESGSIPVANLKNVLLEDMTGVRCPNCPEAAEKAKELKSKHGDRLVVSALYLFEPFPHFTTPHSDTDPDLRSKVSDAIASANGLPPGLPSGFVDRHVFSTQKSLVINQWEDAVETRLLLSSPVNITIEKEKNANGDFILKTKLIYTNGLPAGNQHKFALYILEDGIVAKQSTTGGYINDYVHNHILRASVTAPVGDLMNVTYSKGLVIEKDYLYEWNSDWNSDKAHLVAVVLDNNTDEVIQVAEIKL
jgi:hypothetical protein